MITAASPTAAASNPGWPAHLVGRPCALSPTDWHRLRRDDPAATDVRRAYHEALLKHTADNAPAARPLVSIIIPVYNRADLVVDAVRSCLAQSWRPIEILVVDDGSDDDPASALRPFGDAVTVLRQANGGVSSARNAGIARARGAFILMLDSDDLLLPDAIERLVSGFRAVPDAELCFGMTTDEGAGPPPGPAMRKPDGGRHCPTVNLLCTAVREHPFYLSTVMMPRWVVLATGPFEDDLRRGEDSRYFIRLGLRDTKVVGFSTALGVRRLAKGLSTTPHRGRQAVDTRMRTVRDLIRTPRAWPLVGYRLHQLARRTERDISMSIADLRTIGAFADILAEVTALGDGAYRDGLSPVPLLADIRGTLARGGVFDTGRSGELWRALDDAAAAALRSAAPISARDIAHWSDGVADVPAPTPAMKFCRAVMKHIDQDSELVRHADRVLRSVNPAPASTKRYRRLRRWLRSTGLAARLAWPAAYRRGTR